MKKTFIWFALAAVLCTGFMAPANAQTVIVDPGTRAILDNAVVNVNTADLCAPVLDPCAPACPMPVVETTTCPVVAPACPAPVIETRRSHFLRFGLGPLLDIGIL